MKIPVACPKPAKRGPKERAPLKQKTRMKQRNAKRGGSSFPHQRDAKYRRWVWTENDCLMLGRLVGEPISSHDKQWWPMDMTAWRHVCWGATTPAHVGKHQATGAPDFGVLVPLCKAAHRFYDEHRDQWPRVTGYSERKMALAASGYALRWTEQGGKST